MGSKLLTHDIQTGDITVMSNVTSVTVIGTKVSRLGGDSTDAKGSPSVVHIDFDVKQPDHSPAVLESTETLGMILNLSDAIDLGALLIAMGLAHRTPDEIETVMVQLTQLIQDCA